MMKKLLILVACGFMACSDESTPSTADAGMDQHTTDAADQSPDAPISAATTFNFDLQLGSFFDVPFPSDTRLKPDGTVGYTDFESLYAIQVGKLWLDAGDDLKTGFGLTSAVFMHFDAELDASTLPAVFDDSMEPDANVFLIDVDPDSAKLGERLPVKCKFTAEAGKHHPANQLACASPLGVLREPNTTYALVVTTGVKDSTGQSIGAPAAFEALLAGTDQVGKNGTVLASDYTAAKAAIVAAGTPAEDVAGFALFTTYEPTSRLVEIYDFYAALPEPTLDDTKPIEEVVVYDDYVVLKAFYNVPNIQQGPLPYDTPPAGQIIFGTDGKPVIQYEESLQVNITIPLRAMPAEGYPLFIYAHGSGGQGKELMNRGPRVVATDEHVDGTGPAANIARYGIAGFSMDFALHDTRYPASPDTTGLKLYNILGNPRAMVDNFIIASNEVGLHSRLMKNITIDPSVSSALDPTWFPDGVIKFNADAMSVMGQSMGSMISIPATSLPNEIDALINSGSGGTLIEIALASKDPVDIKPLLRRLLQLKPAEDFDEFDPALNTLQHVFDWIDPTLHARNVIQRPHRGAPSRHVFNPSGLEDRYFSPRGRASVSTALGVPLADPVLEAVAFDWMKWVGNGEPISLPVQSNMPQGVTAFARQYSPAYPEAGHYVMFDKPEALAQYACFVKSLTQGAPVLRTPEDSTPENCP